ncbi:MAG: 30S ribosomal protein S8 [Patescibacteria group bacterium]|nr:30S ribosomal protein S8 [Patescibacteria group bacterium]
MYIDLLIKIKNAEKAKKDSVKTRYSKMDLAVAELLKRCNFLKDAEVKGRSAKKVIEITFGNARLINGLKILSKPSRLLYGGYKDFKKVKEGFGFLVISTPEGLLTGYEARKKKVGGQLLFEIW